MTQNAKSSPRGDRALGHLTVLEVGDGIAGAYCGKLLAGFGARVIKIEPPEGDPLRRQGPFLNGDIDPENSIPFRWFHTGKQSVVLDLAQPQGSGLFKRMVKHADVVVETCKPGHMAQRGLDFANLSMLNPRLVMTSVSNFGQTGPYASFDAEDITLYAMAGLMSATGEPTRAPLASGPRIAQLSAGMKAYIATLMALFRCRAVGSGDHVDVSTQEAAMDNFEIAIAEYLHLKRVAKRNGDEHALVPWRAFPCKDGYAAIIGGPIRHWLKAAELFEEPRLVSERYAHMADRIAHREDVRALMAPWLERHGKKEVFHAGQARKLAFGYVANLGDVLESPQYRARGYLVTDAAPGPAAGEMPGAPFRPAKTPWRHGPAPRLGEHTQSVLQDLLGLADEQLLNEGAVA